MSSLCENDFLKDFQKITKNPEKFLNIQDQSKTQEIKTFLKTLYDLMKNAEPKSLKSNALPELIVEDFDLEQIWQQIELQNEGLLTRSILNVTKLVVNKDKLVFNELQNDVCEENTADEENIDEQQSAESSDDDDDQAPLNLDEDSISDVLSLNSDDNLSDDDEKLDKNTEPIRKSKPSIVDDQFFKLDEMEAFLKAEEKKIDDKEIDSGNDSESDENEDEKDEIDFFQNESDDDMETNDKERGGSKNPKYKDFFGEAAESIDKVKRNKFLEEEDEEEEKRENVKSSYELREERLRNKIEHLEEAAVQEKSWQLKGEITADGRPQNSLLEEIVDFDLTSRPAPVMTEQTTMQLEDVIRQRIKDKAFDSVERKEKPSETPIEYKKKLVLNQEKSKESLAQIYEKEFLEQKEALDPEAAEKEEEEPRLHIEIKTMMHGLFNKLDALSNFHFTPKSAAPDLKIISNLPAITMEEVAPVATTDAALLAPEEVKGKIKGDIMGKSERTDTDKKRERRKKKLKQQKHALLQQKKEMKKVSLGITNKYSKEKAKKMLDKVTKDKNVDKMDESTTKKIKSSTAFFSQLEDEIKTQIKGKTRKLSKGNDSNKINAKKLKL